jgi:photosystem II protein PsbQ
MNRLFRSFLSLVLVVVTTLLVSCSTPTSAKIPTTYTPEKIEALQVQLAPIQTVRERMSELGSLINQENWTDVRDLIHGPFGFLRQDMRYLTEKLLPADQKKAQALSNELFNDMVQIDTAAKDRNYGVALTKFNEAVSDFDAYLDVIPQ